MKMSDRGFQYQNSFEVAAEGRIVEFHRFDRTLENINTGELMISAEEDSNGYPQQVSIFMTSEEATQLKEFLIAQGY